MMSKVLPKVYVAGRYDRRVELSNYAAEITNLGYEVRARWLNGAHSLEDNPDVTKDNEHQFRAMFAEEDLQDLYVADILVTFTEEPQSGYFSGGRHVEFGYSLADEKEIIQVGPRENVFHFLPHIHHFENWADAKVFLRYAIKTRNFLTGVRG